MSIPTKFEDLGVDALRRTAIEDFAVPVDEKANKKVVLAALLEGGVSWADYVKMHPEVAPRVPEPQREGAVITTATIFDEPNVENVDAIPAIEEEKILLKMERKNPIFETNGVRFTDANPYAIVSVSVAERILNTEDGFRQARPSEVEEFYS